MKKYTPLARSCTLALFCSLFLPVAHADSHGPHQKSNIVSITNYAQAPAFGDAALTLQGATCGTIGPQAVQAETITPAITVNAAHQTKTFAQIAREGEPDFSNMGECTVLRGVCGVGFAPPIVSLTTPQEGSTANLIGRMFVGGLVAFAVVLTTLAILPTRLRTVARQVIGVIASVLYACIAGAVSFALVPSVPASGVVAVLAVALTFHACGVFKQKRAAVAAPQQTTAPLPTAPALEIGRSMLCDMQEKYEAVYSCDLTNADTAALFKQLNEQLAEARAMHSGPLEPQTEDEEELCTAI